MDLDMGTKREGELRMKPESHSPRNGCLQVPLTKKEQPEHIGQLLCLQLATVGQCFEPTFLYH